MSELRTSDTVTGEAWAQRFKARIVEWLTTPPTRWTREEAETAAEAEYEATAEHDAVSGYENDPEGSADEAMSYWDADETGTDDARDAARYRFLRQPGNAIVYAIDRNAWGKNASGHVRYDTAEQLDAAVDAARGAAETAAQPITKPCSCAPDYCMKAGMLGAMMSNAVHCKRPAVNGNGFAEDPEHDRLKNLKGHK